MITVDPRRLAQPRRTGTLTAMPPVLGSRQRRAEIIRFAETSGLASVTELAEHFAVTASTIRRDLAHLESAGRLARTYGGAAAPATHNPTPLEQRDRGGVA